MKDTDDDRTELVDKATYNNKLIQDNGTSLDYTNSNNNDNNNISNSNKKHNNNHNNNQLPP